jgi:hypothetical protein
MVLINRTPFTGPSITICAFGREIGMNVLELVANVFGPERLYPVGDVLKHKAPPCPVKGVES